MNVISTPTVQLIAAFLALTLHFTYFVRRVLRHWLQEGLRPVAGAGIVIALSWFVYGAARMMGVHLRSHAARTEARMDSVLLPLLSLALRLTVPIVAIVLLIHVWPFSGDSSQFVFKMSSIALVGSIAWILRRGVRSVEKSIVGEQNTAARIWPPAPAQTKIAAPA